MIWFDKLLPKSRAFLLGKNKQITEFFTALENVYLDAQEFVNDVYLDIWPATTRQLDEWDFQFGLKTDPLLTELQRRNRIDAAWKRRGGQSPWYIQNALQSAGFPVWIHEWWQPGSLPPIARNPHTFLNVGFTPPQAGERYAQANEPTAQAYDISMSVASIELIIEAGDPEASAGEIPAEAGNFILGDDGIAYLLVNKINETVSTTNVMQAGEPIAFAGEPLALSGTPAEPIIFITRRRVYPTPVNVNEWPYILYFCGQVYGTPALIPNNRRDEFEDLLLSICPAQQWLAIQVIYT